MNRSSNCENDEKISTDFQEIVGYRPYWVIRKGNLIFLIVFLLLLSLTWFIQYPDIVNGSIRIMAINPPKYVVAKTEGKLLQLLVKNGEEVKKNSPLAYLQSIASHQQVQSLMLWIDSLEYIISEGKFEHLKNSKLPYLNQLGELQVFYQEFSKIYSETVETLSNGYYISKGRDLRKDVHYLNSILLNTLAQEKLMEKEYELQRMEFNAKEILAKDKVIAPFEFNQDKIKLYAKEQDLERIKAQIIVNNMTVHNKQKEILELNKLFADQHRTFVASLFSMRSKINEWKYRFVVEAPEAGKVLFLSSLNENQYLFNGQDLFVIDPGNALYLGEAMVAQNGIGKIRVDQRVVIKLESYPANEFGYIIGKVSEISTLPIRNDSFWVRINLPFGLRTNYKRAINFKNNLLGRAEIIADDRTLFERFLSNVRDLTNR